MRERRKDNKRDLGDSKDKYLEIVISEGWADGVLVKERAVECKYGRDYFIHE